MNPSGEMNLSDETWEYIAWDVRPARFGGAVGELNRTGWTVTGSEELDGDRQPFPEDARTRDVRWYRIFAQHQVQHG